MLTVYKQLNSFFFLYLLFSFQLLSAHGISSSQKQLILQGGNLEFISIGATHMLSGYDHLAFVFGIVFFLTTFKEIVKYITAFTVGHSITLIIATLNNIQINYYLIDAIIALSVCYIAFQNLDGFKKYLNTPAPNMLFMIFALGLIHGLGLSTRLQELALNQENLLSNIISFNIGIELGQIGALTLMLLLISLVRTKKLFVVFSKVTNGFLILFGLYLFLQQMHSYEHSQNQNLSQKKIQQNKDTLTIKLPALGEKEYKINVDKNASFNYSWNTSKSVLFFDFHAEPKGDTTGYFKSFKEGISDKEKGRLTTTFEGTHGWYWKNYNPFEVIVTLNIDGEYTLTK